MMITDEYDEYEYDDYEWLGAKASWVQILVLATISIDK